MSTFSEFTHLKNNVCEVLPWFTLQRSKTPNPTPLWMSMKLTILSCRVRPYQDPGSSLQTLFYPNCRDGRRLQGGRRERIESDSILLWCLIYLICCLWTKSFKISDSSGPRDGPLLTREEVSVAEERHRSRRTSPFRRETVDKNKNCVSK